MKRSFSVYLAVSILITGCQSLQVQSRADPHTVAVYPGGARDYVQKNGRTIVADESGPCPFVGTIGDRKNGAINLDCFRFPEDAVASGNTATAYARATQAPTYRNRLTSILMKQSDDICTVELSELTADEAIANTALSSATTALAAASTIVTRGLAKTILSGAAATTSGVQGHVNVHIYRNQISQAVGQAISAERNKLKEEILKHYGDNLSKWTVDDAIRDVNEYHRTCSFYKGLELLLAAPGKEKAQEDYLKKRDADVQQLLDALKASQTPPTK